MNKQEVASQMEKGIQAEINDAINMLTQYSSLVEHDQINCKSLTDSATVK